jgi:hypothetical protein
MNVNNQQRTNIQMNIINIIRYFWRQHISLFIEYENNIFCDIGDSSIIIKKRIDENIHNFINEMQKYYGFNRIKILESLLNSHVAITIKLLTDIKLGDTKSTNIHRIEWRQSTDSIAELLSNLNPFWDSQKWKIIFYNYLNLIEKDANLRFSSKCTTDLDSQREVNIILIIADYLANGIIQQFNI